MFNISMTRGVDRAGEMRPVDFDLFGLKVRHASSDHLVMRPSGAFVWQHVRFLIFMAIISLVFLGLVALIYFTAKSPPQNRAAAIVAIGFVISPLVYGLSSLVKLLWVRCEFRMSRNNTLEVVRRGWRTQRHAVSLDTLTAVEYGRKPHAIQRVPVQETTPIESTAKYWIWFVALRPADVSREPTVRLKLLATPYNGTERAGPPDIVVYMCKWLAHISGCAPTPWRDPNDIAGSHSPAPHN